MQMGDKIVVMNHGVIEQFGTPQQIFDKPATMFVAAFIGSPPMNFLRFRGHVAAGADSVLLDGRAVAVPRLHRAADGDLVLGVRPEHIRFADDAALRGAVVAAEYLGTTQIVTLDTPAGVLKARVPSSNTVRPGERLGLSFDAARLTVFDPANGHALPSDLNAGAWHV
jgi:multiple sugar transport system ATP-binding protein